MVERKDLDYYRSLPYERTLRVEHDDDGEYFVASIRELQGVEADGATHWEALFELQAAFDDAIQALLEWGDDIPEPELWPGTERIKSWPSGSSARPTRSSAVFEDSDSINHVGADGAAFDSLELVSAS